MNKRFLINRLFFSFLLVFAFLASACPNFLSPVRSFLDEYTNTAAVASVVFSKELPNDASGTACIPCEDPCTVTFVLRNPQGYRLQPSVSLVSGALLSPADYTLTLAEDRESITLEFSKAFLAAHEMGGDISVRVGLFEPQTGRNFPPYTLALRANTPPPAPRGGIIMATETGNRYVVCFNLDQEALHKDIASITVNDYSTQVNYASAPLGFSNSRFSASASGLGTLVPLGTSPAFSEMGGTLVPVYLVTDDPVNASVNKEYRVTIKDTAGLSTVFSLNTQTDFLDSVKISGLDSIPLNSGAVLNQDPDKTTAHVYIDAPVVTTTGVPVTGVTVYYEMYLDDTYSELYASGSALSGRAEVNLPPVPIYIVTWAQKSGYADSSTDLYAFTVKPERLCVDGSAFGEWNLGTEDYPYTSISDALSTIPNTDPFSSTISIKSDLSAEPIAINNWQLQLTLEGNGHTLSGDSDGNTIPDFRPLRITAGTVTINNLTITKGTADVGGGIFIENGDSTVVLNHCTINENQAETDGGGIYVNNNASLTMIDCEVSGNCNYGYADSFGGGLCVVGNSKVEINRTTVSGNIASLANNGMGGGIYAKDSETSVTVKNSTIEGNSASIGAKGYGGGLCAVLGADVRLHDTVIQLNYGAKINSSEIGYGGGLYLEGANIVFAGAVTIDGNVAQTYNGDGFGGGLYIKNMTGSVMPSTAITISGNMASVSGNGYGGGIFVDSGSFNIGESGSICAISGNIASESGTGFGGGIFVNHGNFTTGDGSSAITISGNTASKNGPGYGGGIAFGTGASVALINVLLESNCASVFGASYGGGIWAGSNFTVKGLVQVIHNTDPKNDVYLVDTNPDTGVVALATINVDGGLDLNSCFLLTPEVYEEYQKILVESPGIISDVHELFSVRPNQSDIWTIDEQGYMVLLP